MQTEEFVLEGMVMGPQVKISFSKTGTRKRALVLKIEAPEPADLPPQMFEALVKDVTALSGRPLTIRAQTMQVGLPLQSAQPNGAADEQVALVK